jgi:hypothetical protein
MFRVHKPNIRSIRYLVAAYATEPHGTTRTIRTAPYTPAPSAPHLTHPHHPHRTVHTRTIRTIRTAPYTRPKKRLSGPPLIQKLGAENHMLQLNI